MYLVANLEVKAAEFECLKFEKSLHIKLQTSVFSTLILRLFAIGKKINIPRGIADRHGNYFNVIILNYG